ncbi:hypothetical protein RSAG8_11296, partial [Rhizoctonia solani AG-8 WAC10335]
MPRPSKRKLASRDNLLKARAKMNQLRSLHMNSDGGCISRTIESDNIERAVYLNGLTMENNDQGGTASQRGPSVTTTRLGSRLEEHPREMVSGPRSPNENGAIPENRAHVNEESLNYNQSAGQPVDGRMVHKGVLVADHCPEDSKCEVKMGTDLVLNDNARQLVTTSERAGAMRPVGQRPKTYLRIYKENYRASKKMKLSSQFSTSDGDLWRAEGASLEGRYMATVGI